MVEISKNSLIRHHNYESHDESEAKIKILENQIAQLNRKLKDAQEKATSALQIKSDFLSNISHEIRTPLNAVLGFSQWLYENTGDEQHREYLSTILMSAKGLSNLLNDILDLSKIESGKIRINNIPVHFTDMINDIKQVFYPIAKKRNIEIQFTTEPSIPDYILIDEIRLYQIIFNLVGKVIKYANTGFIHIRSYAEEAAFGDKINLIISVEITGTCIKEDEKESIFENFTKTRTEKQNLEKETGLEQAIVKGLIEKMNGTINVDSIPGKDTTITVSFNEVKIDYNKNIQKETRRKDCTLLLEPCKIMIVDDINYNILVLKKLIGSKNVTFIEANDGINALAKLETEKPDLIFMDIRMPGVNGFDTTKMIKQNKKLMDIPVVAFTGSTIDDENSKIHSIFNGFLQKPVFKENLETVLKQFLKHTYKPLPHIQKKEQQKTSKISEKCLKNTPQLLKEINEYLMPEWKKIKNTLIIFEIENFKNQIYTLATEKSCNSILLQYYNELESGLKSFDIEMIKETIDDFPQFIRTIEGQYQKMIH